MVSASLLLATPVHIQRTETTPLPVHIFRQKTPRDPSRTPAVAAVPAVPTRAAQDQILLAAVAQGDRRAFATLYEQFAASVYRMVHSVIRDPAQAEEISQEVFLAIWREAARFDPLKGSVSGYISMLAHAKAVDRVRSAQAARTRDEKYTTKNIDRNEHHDPVVERTMMRDESVQIRAALGGLTTYQREAIELYFFDRHTYQEVGQMLGVSAAAVKARVRGAVLQLRNRMAEMNSECA